MKLIRFRGLALSLLLLVSSMAEANTFEKELKAASPYRFTQFVEWPPRMMVENDGEFLLCVLGKDSFDDVLEGIDGKSVGERTIVVRHIKEPQQIGQCHIVFINQPKSAWAEIQQQSQNAHMLTVSDYRVFAASGGAIELVSANKRIQFIINLTVAKAADLHISAHLLKLARHIL